MNMIVQVLRRKYVRITDIQDEGRSTFLLSFFETLHNPIF